MCEWKPDFDSVSERVTKIEARMEQVEHDMGKMRSETQEGIRALTASVANLAHDFGSRMNSMDARLVEEKVKWGDTLRGIVKWTAKVILICVLAAVGLNYGASLYKMIFVN
jgi:uncharacterized membrane protein YdfJ with MMPL/SSD domain